MLPVWWPDGSHRTASYCTICSIFFEFSLIDLFVYTCFDRLSGVLRLGFFPIFLDFPFHDPHVNHLPLLCFNCRRRFVNRESRFVMLDFSKLVSLKGFLRKLFNENLPFKVLVKTLKSFKRPNSKVYPLMICKGLQSLIQI